MHVFLFEKKEFIERHEQVNKKQLCKFFNWRSITPLISSSKRPRVAQNGFPFSLYNNNGRHANR